jgi:hypothetical protein
MSSEGPTRKSLNACWQLLNDYALHTNLIKKIVKVYMLQKNTGRLTYNNPVSKVHE